MNIMDNIVRCISVRKERIRNTFAESNSIRRMDLLFWAFTPHNFSLEINVSIMTELQNGVYTDE